MEKISKKTRPKKFHQKKFTKKNNLKTKTRMLVTTKTRMLFTAKTRMLLTVKTRILVTTKTRMMIKIIQFGLLMSSLSKKRCMVALFLHYNVALLLCCKVV
jgi:uncharacterized protein YebE (UPF0316 family)